MSKEESKNRLEKALYIKSSMGKTQLFKPNHDCSARFLNFCSSEAEILKHEFYGTMCRPCMTEAKRIHEKALNEPVKFVTSWIEKLKTGGK